jgi:LPXTG-site transpeptidase (sortase) family protein
MRRKVTIRAGILIFGVPIMFASSLGVFVWHAEVSADSRVISGVSTRAFYSNIDTASTTVQLAINNDLGVVGTPKRIKIPRIRVDGAIEAVSLDAGGFMGTPKRPSNAAWYKPGTRPGEVGSAAIAGHVDWYNGAKAIFANLRKVRVGDSVIVIDENGVERSFVVRKTLSLDAAADATDVFSSTDGKAHLNLITCSGSWNKKAKQYSKRLVVFADSVN